MTYTELEQEIQNNLPIPDREELWESIKNNNLKKYTPKQIEHGMLQKLEGKNLYTLAAEKGHLDKIPKELLTQENLAKPDGYNLTCLHWAAVTGHLDQIPKEILTEENLLQPNSFNRTCLHLAAKSGHLDQIAKEVLTKENLLLPDDGGLTCLHWATEYGHLAQIPKELLTTENLIKPDTDGNTCLHWAALNGYLDKIPPLSYETLQELKTHFEAKDSSQYKEDILKTLNELLEKKIKRLEIIARSQEINHDTNIL
jgi:hypothetical protein